MAVSVFLLVALLVWDLSSTGKVGSGQSTVQPNSVSLHKAVKRFLEYNRDFITFAKSGSPGSPEREVVWDLETVASRASDVLGASSVLLEVRDSLSCEEDRARINPLLRDEFLNYSRLIELDIESVNNGISYIDKPGVAVEAIRMRDDLRDSKRMLDSIKFP
jgi:hypothetical protein